MHVTIMMGLPGAGKSTWIRANCTHEKIVSADFFFTTPDGGYAFDGSKIRQAHEWCFATFQRYLERGEDVVVDNTNVRNWEREKYVQEALRHGATVSFLHVDTPLNVCLRRNKRRGDKNVPAHVIRRMHNSFEPPKEEWLDLGAKYLRVPL